MDLDKELILAEKACKEMEERADKNTISLSVRMAPFTHYNNLFWAKTEEILSKKYENQRNLSTDKGKQ
jgi:hypothetical protein